MPGRDERPDGVPRVGGLPAELEQPPIRSRLPVRQRPCAPRLRPRMACHPGPGVVRVVVDRCAPPTGRGWTIRRPRTLRSVAGARSPGGGGVPRSCPRLVTVVGDSSRQHDSHPNLHPNPNSGKTRGPVRDCARLEDLLGWLRVPGFGWLRPTRKGRRLTILIIADTDAQHPRTGEAAAIASVQSARPPWRRDTDAGPRCRTFLVASQD